MNKPWSNNCYAPSLAIQVKSFCRYVLGLLLCGLSATSLAAASDTACQPNEDSLFACYTKRKTYEVCASRDLSATSGYMQYRVLTAKGSIEFVYPPSRIPPAGKFMFSLLNRGAELTFQNYQYTYALREGLMGNAEIIVSTNNGAKNVVIECDGSSEILTLTKTIQRFQKLGIYR